MNEYDLFRAFFSQKIDPKDRKKDMNLPIFSINYVVYLYLSHVKIINQLVFRKSS